MVTREDVARHAGVSKTTVSRVLNKTGYVSEESRGKIEKAISELGYSPNLIARSLKTRQSRQILFSVHDILNPFYMEVYRGMEDCCEENGYTIVLSRNFDPLKIRQHQYDGLILSDISQGRAQEPMKPPLPAIVTDYSGIPLPITSVGIDIKAGAEKATNHLLENGHRKIAFLTICSNLEDQRLQGFYSSLEKTGLDAKAAPVICAAHTGSEYIKGYFSAKELLGKTRDFTAVFAFNDAMAIGALSAFSESNIQVPRDVSLIGFDNILQGGFTIPKLTTVNLPKYKQGYESALALINMIQGRTVRSMTLDTSLILRDSVQSI